MINKWRFLNENDISCLLKKLNKIVYISFLYILFFITRRRRFWAFHHQLNLWTDIFGEVFRFRSPSKPRDRRTSERQRKSCKGSKCITHLEERHEIKQFLQRMLLDTHTHTQNHVFLKENIQKILLEMHSH